MRDFYFTINYCYKQTTKIILLFSLIKNLFHLFTYNELGQLHCILCKSQVKSEAVWPVHLNSKQHRENLAIAKQGKEELEKKIAQKRVAPPTNDAANQDTPPKKIKGILKNSSSTAPPVSKLPDDFFDKPNNLASRLPPTIVKSSQPEEIVEEAAPVDVNKGKDQTHLPEGFFDDPIMDAKVSLIFLIFTNLNIKIKFCMLIVSLQ